MPYYTCPKCRLDYYSAAAWVDAPECPHCFEPQDRRGQVLGRLVFRSRRPSHARESERRSGRG
jgi:hypothetical protein